MIFPGFWRVFPFFSAACVCVVASAALEERSSAICRPFSFYAGAKTPKPWKKAPDERRSPSHSIEAAFKNWESTHPDELTPAAKLDWLHCLSFYSRQDTDGDGISDWSALSDGKPATTLFALDEDIDGDGTPNILDPDPFDRRIQYAGPTGSVPAHLKITRAITSELQEKLFSEFGILAIDHTDEHSPLVLEQLLFLLRNALHRDSVRALNSFGYLYAFEGHDSKVDLAAYHHQARAISIGGLSAYPVTGRGADAPQVDILATLAHELGHAFIFAKLSPRELREVSERFGGWTPVFAGVTPPHLHSAPFFRGRGRSPASAPTVSTYSETGVHEWFADSFAAFVLKRLGQRGKLGQDWTGKLTVNPRNSRAYKADFNRLSPEFSAWFDKRLK